MAQEGAAEATIRDIKRKTRRKYNTEEKNQIVIEGLRGEQSIAELCRRAGIAESLYYSWSKEFMEAGEARLAGNPKRQASSSEVEALRWENEQLKQLVAELALKNRGLKKSVTGAASEWDA
jgi:transposase